MAHETPRANRCPTLETWCAYVDGSIPESVSLAEHLQQCDRCFALVVSIKTALEEPDTAHRTPEALLKQARQIDAPPHGYQWILYAAAAVLVLGLGIRAVYRPAPAPHPLSGAVFAHLSTLDTELQKRGYAWSDMMAEQARSLPGVPDATFDIPPSARAAVLAGSAFIQMKVHLEYADDFEDAANQFEILKSALQQMQPGVSLPQTVHALASKLQAKGSSGHALSNLVLGLHRDIEHRIREGAPEIQPYFHLGEWLQSIQTTAVTAAYLSVPFSPLAGANGEIESARNAIAYLREAQTPEGLVTALTSLTSAIQQTGAESEKIGEILEQVNDLLSTLTIY